MSPLEASARELEAASTALREALRRGDAEALEQARLRRERAFEALASHAPESLSPAVRACLARVARDEAVLCDEARRVHEALRRELEALAATRRAARALRPDEAPRFVSRRV